MDVKKSCIREILFSSGDQIDQRVQSKLENYGDKSNAFYLKSKN